MPRLRHSLDAVILSELEPTVKGSVKPEDRFHAILVLRWYPLASTSNGLCRTHLAETGRHTRMMEQVLPGSEWVVSARLESQRVDREERDDGATAYLYL